MAFCSSCGQELTGGAGCPSCDNQKRSFYGSELIDALRDFEMKKYVTPKILRIIYIIGAIVIASSSFLFLVNSFYFGGIGGFLLTLIVVIVFSIVSLSFLRIFLEIAGVLFKILEELKEINIKLKRQEIMVENLVGLTQDEGQSGGDVLN